MPLVQLKSPQLCGSLLCALTEAEKFLRAVEWFVLERCRVITLYMIISALEWICNGSKPVATAS